MGNRWQNFEPTRPISADDGIKTHSKRGTFVKNWWANRWIKAMEQVMDRGRLSRGRTYARQGQVLNLEEQAGQIVGKVQGSRPTPYDITITLTPLAEEAWQQVEAALRERPLFVARLLTGEMPQEIEEAFHAVNLNLFPGKGELQQECKCPDWASVCKHLAAAHYILAERFDQEPFLLFRMRGRSREQLLNALVDNQETTKQTTAPPATEAVTLPLLSADFWQPGPDAARFPVQITLPELPFPILQRLGDPEFAPQIRPALATAWEAASTRAIQIAWANQPPPEEEPRETE